MGQVTARQPFATVPVLSIAAAVVVGLLVLASWHGFHRDELYFVVAGQHPAFGYPDQPPLTPLLAAAATALLGVEPFASRVLPAFCAGATIMLAAAMARDMHGGPRAQIHRRGRHGRLRTAGGRSSRFHCDLRDRVVVAGDVARRAAARRR